MKELKLPTTPVIDLAESLSLGNKQKQLEETNRRFRLISGNLIYGSKQGNRLNFNTKATDENGEEICCRHLASYVAQLPRAIKGYHDALGNKDNIAAAPYLKSNHHDKHIHDFKQFSALVPIDGFGRTLALLAHNVPVGHELSLVLNSENHSMGLSITHKPTQLGHSQYIIKFYDPNITDSHLRAICPNTTSIEALKLSDFIPDEIIPDYFPSRKEINITSNTTCATKEERSLHIEPNYLSSHVIYHCAINGFQKQLEEILSYLITTRIVKNKSSHSPSPCMSYKEVEELFRAEFIEKSLFNIVMFHTQNPLLLTQLANWVLRQPLPSQDRFDLLKKITGNFQDFNNLIKDGTVSTVKSFIMSILKSDLSLGHKQEIFLTVRMDSIFGEIPYDIKKELTGILHIASSSKSLTAYKHFGLFSDHSKKAKTQTLNRISRELQFFCSPSDLKQLLVDYFIAAGKNRHNDKLPAYKTRTCSSLIERLQNNASPETYSLVMTTLGVQSVGELKEYIQQLCSPTYHHSSENQIKASM